MNAGVSRQNVTRKCEEKPCRIQYNSSARNLVLFISLSAENQDADWEEKTKVSFKVAAF